MLFEDLDSDEFTSSSTLGFGDAAITSFADDLKKVIFGLQKVSESVFSPKLILYVFNDGFVVFFLQLNLRVIYGISNLCFRKF